MPINPILMEAKKRSKMVKIVNPVIRKSNNVTQQTGTKPRKENPKKEQSALPELA